jgi:hypothetical protein
MTTGAVRVIRNKLKLGYGCINSGNKKCEQLYGSAYDGVWRTLRLTRVWSQVVFFMRLTGNWLQSP